jgi:hypothetical protein
MVLTGAATAPNYMYMRWVQVMENDAVQFHLDATFALSASHTEQWSLSCRHLQDGNITVATVIFITIADQSSSKRWM